MPWIRVAEQDRMRTYMESHGIRAPPPLPPRTKWTRRVPHPVLIGHAASNHTAFAPHTQRFIQQSDSHRTMHPAARHRTHRESDACSTTADTAAPAPPPDSRATHGRPRPRPPLSLAPELVLGLELPKLRLRPARPPAAQRPAPAAAAPHSCCGRCHDR
jgi:hypothetical protein